MSPKLEMIPTLDNFLSYGSDVFKSRGDYRNMIVDIYTTVLSSDNLGENDFINGSKLADSILLNLRGHVDDVCILARILVVEAHTTRSTCK
jgi:importin-7